MLSKEQANAIAGDILRDARQSKEKRKGWASAPVPLLYKCRELSAMEPRMRAELIRQATSAVNRDPLFVLCALLWIAGFVLFGLNGAERLFGAKNVAAFFIVCGLAPMIGKGLLIRHEARKIAGALSALRVN